MCISAREARQVAAIARGAYVLIDCEGQSETIVIASGSEVGIAAAAAVGLVLPDLKGLIDGFAIRVPTINVSLVDLSFNAARKSTLEEIHSVVKAAANGPLKGILAYNDAPLVSVDFNHDPASSTYDATLTKVMAGTLVKVCAWYDNEWGFSNRMLDTTLAWSKVA
jgi:glyceraldehyde 3-phosphate dehydrogenase